MKELEELLLCSCENPEHQMIFRTINGDEDVYVTIHLRRFPLLKRLWGGIRYIFGYTSMYGDFDEFIIHPKDSKKLKKVIKYLDTIHVPIV